MAKILIVDDQPTNRQFLVTLLGYFGHQGSEAGDAQEGLRLVRELRPDLAIVDVGLPGMDGYELVRRLRSEPDIAHTLVILYSSGDDTPQTRAEANAYGVQHVLRKPVEPQVILNTVNTVLGAEAPIPSSASLDEFDRHYLDLRSGRIEPGAIVFVVDDEPIACREVASILESASFKVECYSSAEEFLQEYTSTKLGCLVLDFELPGMSGIALVQVLRERQAELPVIVLTGHGNVSAAVRSMKLGVFDFLEKPVNRRILISEVHQALREETARRGMLAEKNAVRRQMSTVTVRELELLRLLIGGMSNKQLAVKLGISIKTVANHRAHLMEKTGAMNAADLVRMSMIAGIRPPQ